jgi:hypothetical protein
MIPRISPTKLSSSISDSSVEGKVRKRACPDFGSIKFVIRRGCAARQTNGKGRDGQAFVLA